MGADRLEGEVLGGEGQQPLVRVSLALRPWSTVQSSGLYIGIGIGMGGKAGKSERKAGKSGNRWT